MLDRRKALMAVAVMLLMSALAIMLAPRFIFPVCESPMHCYYSYMAELGMASVIAAGALGMLFSPKPGAVRALGPVLAVAGVFVILFPQSLIGVCGSPRMACNYGMLPVWRLLGGGVILLSAAGFFLSKKEDD